MPDASIQLNRLGLALRAGKLRCGAAAVRDALNGGHATLIIVAQDAGATTRRRVQQLALQAGCPLMVIADRTSLGKALGRDAQAVIAVTDARFAELIEHSD